ncbi:hypothetical protein WMW72_12300 [Paenibacillus filicis]|uniref:Uncharacterized protein n=1 Tax=Paenibacillus filicis TaxID=669464 RepID=A0ABU9DIK3_9BACL
MSNNLITTIKSTTRLFRQPYKIGDVIDVKDRPVLILGIEKYELWGNDLAVWYTVQHLDMPDYVSLKKAYKQPHEVELEIQFPYNDDRLKKVYIGSTWTDRGITYKLIEYSEIALKGTDLYLSFIARPLYPVDRKEAKAVLSSQRRKKIGLELI